jgi:5-hydroxyisourate hydrolase-like protein (transthyretin family)
VRSKITRGYAHRAVRITGRLLNAAGQPIDGATLEVLQQVSGSPTPTVIAHARTGSNGTFAATAPGGPTRTIEVAYRAFSTDANYAARAAIQESVSAGVRLNVSPRRTSPEGTITLSGRVLGPVPAQGVVVELLVHYRGHWEPFRDPRTDSRGRFHVAYQFQGGVGRFPFRALVFGNQSGFPFIHGESGAVDVFTN